LKKKEGAIVKKRVILYHATPVEKLRSILRCGLQKKFSQDKLKRIFLESTPEGAQYYGMITYALAHRESIVSDYEQWTCKTRVAIIAIEVLWTELRRDFTLENKRRNGKRPLRECLSFGTHRNIPRSRIKAYTIQHATLGDHYI